MFFSTESWNSGGGGKSTARNRKGDTFDLISDYTHQSRVEDVFMQKLTSINVKLGSLILACIGTNENMLRLHSQLTLEC